MQVCLTFDAEHASRPCKGCEATEILAILSENGIRATFFLEGRWASAYPASARGIAEAGHVLGNHSAYHAPFSLLSSDGIRADIVRAEQAIERAAGVSPKPWFRFPFGDSVKDPRVNAILSDLGYRHVWWDIDTADWMPGRSVEEIVSQVSMEAEQAVTPLRILLHTWPMISPPALREIISLLKTQDANFLTVDDL